MSEEESATAKTLPSVDEGIAAEQPGVVVFPPTDRGEQDSMYRREHPLFVEGNAAAASPEQQQLMGPLLRRKRVVSMPLGAGGDFFVSEDLGGPHRQLGAGGRQRQLSVGVQQARQKQLSHETAVPPRVRQMTPTSPGGTVRRRTKQSSFMDNLVRRKQISLDLLGPNDFFAVPTSDEEEEPGSFGAPAIPDVVQEDEEVVCEAGEAPREKRLFLPLRFAPPVHMGAVSKHKSGSGHTGGHGPTTESKHGPSMFVTTAPLPRVVEEASEVLRRQSQHSETIKLQLSALQNKIDEAERDQATKEMLLSVSSRILETQLTMEEEQKKLLQKIDMEQQQHSKELASSVGGEDAKAAKILEDEEGLGNMAVLEDDNIVRADKCDKIKAGVVFLIMLVFTVVVCTWHTHIMDESHIYSPVGLACVTDCPGDLETRDFFHGHNHFEHNQVIQVIVHIDPNVEANDTYAIIEIVGEESGMVKSTIEVGPVSHEERTTFDPVINVEFEDPQEHHVINVNSSTPEVELGFTLVAEVRTPLADYSVIVAAVIMVIVYAFILVEVIHRTLIAIFGSMFALLFLFIMNDGATESIKQIMLSMEWSTLGLLFGMMLLVGELSHTGIFEWCAVRLLVASRGSFNLLMVLLGVLTACASAFLDNVTTMLLVAPVTIDMCSILGVDPRPYLIGEVLLSNVGGTATLIGDPPNIIIGTSFEEIDFVGFVINVLPAIFVFILPVTVLMILRIYRHYFSSSKMKVLDTEELKKTYPIYDQPRLMIAGTVTAFVIVIFFLHSVHHKDTAWIALFGAFVTIAFTNPHDVQDALRNHIEWDTLLFFAGLFVLVEACAHMGLLEAIGGALASYIELQPEESQLSIAITLVIWVSAFVSAFLDNIPYTATMIPVVQILADKLETLDLATLAWALSFGACLGGNGTLLGASANIVTAGISKNKGYDISFLNFLYPGMLVMIASVAIANLYMLIRYVWI